MSSLYALGECRLQDHAEELYQELAGNFDVDTCACGRLRTGVAALSLLWQTRHSAWEADHLIQRLGVLIRTSACADREALRGQFLLAAANHHRLYGRYRAAMVWAGAAVRHYEMQVRPDERCLESARISLGRAALGAGESQFAKVQLILALYGAPLVGADLDEFCAEMAYQAGDYESAALSGVRLRNRGDKLSRLMADSVRVRTDLKQNTAGSRRAAARLLLLVRRNGSRPLALWLSY